MKAKIFILVALAIMSVSCATAKSTSSNCDVIVDNVCLSSETYTMLKQAPMSYLTLSKVTSHIADSLRKNHVIKTVPGVVEDETHIYIRSLVRSKHPEYLAKYGGASARAEAVATVEAIWQYFFEDLNQGVMEGDMEKARNLDEFFEKFNSHLQIIGKYLFRNSRAVSFVTDIQFDDRSGLYYAWVQIGIAKPSFQKAVEQSLTTFLESDEDSSNLLQQDFKIFKKEREIRESSQQAFDGYIQQKRDTSSTNN